MWDPIRRVSSPSDTAKLTKGFRDKYSLYILFPKELTEALNTIIHSKRGEITVRTVLQKHVISVNVLRWTWAALFCSLWSVGLSLRSERWLIFSSPVPYSGILWKTFRPHEANRPSGELSVMSLSVVEVRLEVRNEICMSSKELLSGPRSTFWKEILFYNYWYRDK